MATLSSYRFYSLIERIFAFQRDAPSAVFDIVKVKYSALDALAGVTPAPRVAVDEAWIRRPELRGSKAVIAFLEAEGFRNQVGTTQALFVDDRCGLIGGRKIADAQAMSVTDSVADVLRLACSLHASGVVLATNNLGCVTRHNSALEDLTMEIYRKGEATDVFLLDHFIVTDLGWRRMFAVREQDRL